MDKRIGFAEFVFFILVIGVPAHASGGRAVADNEQKVDAVRFTILSADGQEVIGSSEYRTEHLHDRTLLVGENRYKDGEHDVERDELAFNKGNTVPVMVNFEHTFFNRTALTSCSRAQTRAAVVPRASAMKAGRNVSYPKNSIFHQTHTRAQQR